MPHASCPAACAFGQGTGPFGGLRRATGATVPLICHWHVPFRSSVPTPAVARFPPPRGEGEGGGLRVRIHCAPCPRPCRAKCPTRVGTDVRRKPDACHPPRNARIVAAPATIAPRLTPRPKPSRTRRKPPLPAPPHAKTLSRPQPQAPQPLFDFSTNYPQGISKVYPQKPFMLQCYFLARLATAGPTFPYRNGSQDTGRGAKVSVTVGREDRASAGSELRNARNANGSWNVSGRETFEGGERAGAGS